MNKKQIKKETAINGSVMSKLGKDKSGGAEKDGGKVECSPSQLSLHNKGSRFKG